MIQAIIGGGSMVITGFIVLLLVNSINANIPNGSDIAEMVLEETGKMKVCGENPACIHNVQIEFNAINWYQQVNSARETGQFLGMFLIITPIALGIVFAIKR